MRIEAHLNRWVIVRGNVGRQSFFSFFVDDDSASWTKRKWNCHKFRTHKEAEEALKNLWERNALKRQRRSDREEGRT